MTKIKTEDCKRAVVEFIAKNPGCISSQFCLEDSTPEQLVEFEKPSLSTSSWARRSKRRVPGSTAGHIERMFECSATEKAMDLYEDQLRAYTVDDGEKILSVKICGE
jgi:hypothetical protein